MTCRVSKLERHRELQRPDVPRGYGEEGARMSLPRIRYFLGREVAVSHAPATPMLRKILHVLFPPAQERRNINETGANKTTGGSSGLLTF